MAKIRINGSSGGINPNIYLAWMLKNVHERIMARVNEGDRTSNIDSVRTAWYSLGGKYTERSEAQMRNELQEWMGEL